MLQLNVIVQKYPRQLCKSFWPKKNNNYVSHYGPMAKKKQKNYASHSTKHFWPKKIVQKYPRQLYEAMAKKKQYNEAVQASSFIYQFYLNFLNYCFLNYLIDYL